MKPEDIAQLVHHDERLRSMLTTAGASAHAYPWEALERGLHCQNQTRLAIASFGALMGSDEGAQLLDDPGTFTSGRPVVVFGAKRVFEYEIPERNFRRYGEPPVDDQRAALNAVGTGESSHFFNAVLLDVDIGRLEYLREREAGYDLCPAVCKAWDAMDAPARACYVLSAPRGDGSPWTRGDLRPFMPYVNACRRACRLIGEPFEELFLRTSYLGDMRTPLSVYLGRV